MDVSVAPVRLSELEPGQPARFYDHAPSLDGEARDLLRALGLTASAVVRVRKRGEPCIVQIRSTRIGLSASVASQILVLPQAGA